METTIKKQKLIRTGAIVMLLSSLLLTGFLFVKTGNLKKDADKERLYSEKLLSEKLALEKEIAQFKIHLYKLNGRNETLDKIIADVNNQLKEKESEVKSLKSSLAGMNSLKNHLADVTAIKNNFEKRVNELNLQVDNLLKENASLNKTIAQLNEENKLLASNLEILSSMVADNYLAESNGRKNKMTVNAKRTRKIALSFKVPQGITSSLSFKILKPDGSVVEGKENGISYNVVKEGNDLYASATEQEIVVTQKVEMQYEPKDKLKSGIYKIEIYNTGKYVGSCQVKLK